MRDWDSHDGTCAYTRHLHLQDYYRLASRWLRPSSLCLLKDETIAPAGGLEQCQEGREPVFRLALRRIKRIGCDPISA
jgi:hypothetical protein